MACGPIYIYTNCGPFSITSTIVIRNWCLRGDGGFYCVTTIVFGEGIRLSDLVCGCALVLTLFLVGSLYDI